MNIYEALEHCSHVNRIYFMWKHDLKFDQTREKWTEQQLLNNTNRKTFNGFKKWERTPEYKALLAIYLDSQMASDLEEIYEKVAESAKSGESASVKLYLALTKELQAQKKTAIQFLNSTEYEEDEPEEDDDLDLD
ncbi:hypothetical protein ACQ4XT_11450 [Halobacillus faecis]